MNAANVTGVSAEFKSTRNFHPQANCPTRHIGQRQLFYIKHFDRIRCSAGAAPDSIEVLDIEELPLAYVPGGAVRLRVKVAGTLEFS